VAVFGILKRRKTLERIKRPHHTPDIMPSHLMTRERKHASTVASELGVVAADAIERERSELAVEECLSPVTLLETGSEIVLRLPPGSVDQAGTALFECIETWYNRRRLDSSIDYVSPDEFEAMEQAP